MKCTKCGNELSEENMVCEKCGNRNDSPEAVSIQFGALWKASWISLKGKKLSSIAVLMIPSFLSFLGSIILGHFWALLTAPSLLRNMIDFLFKFIVFLPMSVGVVLFFLNCAKGEECKICNLFEPYKKFLHYIWVVLRNNIFVGLWCLLFVIPGIIAALRYALTTQLALDNPDLSAKDAMRISCELMNGYKLTLFGYTLLWGLILVFGGVLTLGIALIWLIPMVFSFWAHFYLAIKSKTGHSFSA